MVCPSYNEAERLESLIRALDLKVEEWLKRVDRDRLRILELEKRTRGIMRKLNILVLVVGLLLSSCSMMPEDFECKEIDYERTLEIEYVQGKAIYILGPWKEVNRGYTTEYQSIDFERMTHKTETVCND